ncbi:MAG: hypothetical protein JWN04_5668 [Myxococcaceae bacterium]|nr:hypothetical protein [Myxococcaceae bacterium]
MPLRALLMVLTLLVSSRVVADDGPRAGVALADEPRSMFNAQWIASGVVVGVWGQATADAGPDGPERVVALWMVTCVVDAWAAGHASFDQAVEAYAEDCTRWAQLPGTATQTRGTPTPYTAGRMNSMMLTSVYASTVKRLRDGFPGATEPQVQAATGCLMDLDRSQGDDALLAAFVENGPCFRYAQITSDDLKRPARTKKTRPAKVNGR